MEVSVVENEMVGFDVRQLKTPVSRLAAISTV